MSAPPNPANGNGPRPTMGQAGLRPNILPPNVYNQDFAGVLNEAVANALTARTEMFRRLFDPRRNLADECGWPADETGYGSFSISPDLYRMLYDRDPIAARVVQLMPEECWQKPPTVFENEDPDVITPFEEAWDNLGRQLYEGQSWYQDEAGSPVWQALKKADTLSGIGAFGLILIGVADGKNLEEPVDGVVMRPTINTEGTVTAHYDTGNANGLRGRLRPSWPDSYLVEHEENALNDPKPSRVWNGRYHQDGKAMFEERRPLPLNDGEKVVLNRWRGERQFVLNAQREAALNAGKPRQQSQWGGIGPGPGNPVSIPDSLRGGPGSQDNPAQSFGSGMGFVPNQPRPYQPQSNPSSPLQSGPMSQPLSTTAGIKDQGGPYTQGAGLGGVGGSVGGPYGPSGSLSGTDAQYFGVITGPTEVPSDEPAKYPDKQRPKITFLRVFDESLVQIVRYEWNVNNPRFGKPVMYRVTLNDPRVQHTGVGLPMSTVFVHWSRVIHVADCGKSSSEIFAVPQMQTVLNTVLDIRKVRGASAEGYYKSCFDGETQFFDGNCLRKLRDCVGESVIVTCADGKKRVATVQSFGRQKFVRVELGLAKHGRGARGSFRRFINATPDHRWVLSDGTVTTTLKPGDVLVANHFPDKEEPPFDAWGFAHGVVFGDGWIENRKYGTHQTTVKLHGKKRWMFDRLKQVSHLAHRGEDRPDGKPLLRFTNYETNMKQMPVDGKHPAGYVYWFLQGWLATDGHICKDRDGGIISSSKPSAIEWFFANSPYYGYEIVGFSTYSEPTDKGERSYPLHNIRYRRRRTEYEVKAITDEGKSGEAFCVVEPVTKTFTLEGGVVTGNCFQGLQFSTHPQLGGDVILDTASLKDQVENYWNGLQRVLMSAGGQWSTLAPSVVDPTPHIEAGIGAICIVKGCPVRVFKGSERGELASSQDDEAWNERKAERQINYLTPRLIVVFIDRLILMGVLPEPDGKVVATKPKPKPFPKPPAPPAPGGPPSGGGKPFGGGGESPTGNRRVVRYLHPDGRYRREFQGSLKDLYYAENVRTNSRGERPVYNLADPSYGVAPAQALEKRATVVDVGGYSIEWPELDSLGETDRVAIALQKTQAIQAFVAGQCESVFPARDWLTRVMNYDEEEADAIIDSVRDATEADAPLTIPLTGEEGHPATVPPPPPKPIIVGGGGPPGTGKGNSSKTNSSDMKINPGNAPSPTGNRLTDNADGEPSQIPGWVTLESGQHVYISYDGGMHFKGPKGDKEEYPPGHPKREAAEKAARKGSD